MNDGVYIELRVYRNGGLRHADGDRLGAGELAALRNLVDSEQRQQEALDELQGWLVRKGNQAESAP